MSTPYFSSEKIFFLDLGGGETLSWIFSSYISFLSSHERYLETCKHKPVHASGNKPGRRHRTEIKTGDRQDSVTV